MAMSTNGASASGATGTVGLGMAAKLAAANPGSQGPFRAGNPGLKVGVSAGR
jgi:hypothetical protein